MRVVCDMSCQIRIKGKIHTIVAGEILTLDVDECPEYFHEIGKRASEEDTSTDFENIGDAELREMDGDVEALKEFVELNYPEISFAKNIGWPTLAARYVEARNNRVTKIDNTGKTKNTIVDVHKRLDLDFKDSDGDGMPDSSQGAFDDIDDLLKED